MLYCHDVLTNYNLTVLGVLSSETIMRSYGLEQRDLWAQHWSCGTPDGVSGSSSLASQVGHFPSSARGAHLGGNQSSSGRRVVTYSRARVFSSSHSCGECFEASTVPDTWRRHRAAVTNSGGLIQTIDLRRCREEGTLLLVPIAGRLCPNLNERGAFKTLFNIIRDLPKFTKDVRRWYPNLVQHFPHDGSQNMKKCMLAVADGLIPEVVEEERIRGGDDADDEDSEDLHVEADDHSCVPESRRWTVPEYHVEAVKMNGSLRLLPYLLRAVPYKFGATSGQATPMVIQRDHSHDITQEIICFQRVVGYIFVRTFAEELGDKITVQHVPHKLRVIQGRAIRDCHSTRMVQVLSAPTAVEGNSSVLISYSYLGGGLQWDPPHGYGLVTRKSSLKVVDMYCALCVFLSSGTLDRDMFWFVPPDKLRERPTMKQMRESVEKRFAAVLKHLNTLRDKFENAAGLVQRCGLQWSGAICTDPSPEKEAQSWQCLGCDSSDSSRNDDTSAAASCILCGHADAAQVPIP